TMPGNWTTWGSVLQSATKNAPRSRRSYKNLLVVLDSQEKLPEAPAAGAQSAAWSGSHYFPGWWPKFSSIISLEIAFATARSFYDGVPTKRRGSVLFSR